MDFGNQTLSGDGGYQMTNGSGTDLTNVVDAGTGTASGYSLTSGGLVTPSSNGGLSAQNGNTIDVTSDQGSFTFTFNILSGLGGGNAYSISGFNELETFMELSTLAYGDTGYLRGVDINPSLSTTASIRRTTAISGTVNGKDNLAHSGLVTITPHAGETPKIWRININGTDIAENGFHFYKCTFRSPVDAGVAGSTVDSVSLQGFGSNAPTDVKVTECFGGIEGGYTAGDDPYSFVEGMGARFHAEQNFVSGCYDFIKCKGADCIIRNNKCEGCTNDGYKFTDCPSLLHEGDEVTNKTVRYEEWIITGVTRGATTTVTVTAATQNPSSSRTTYIRGSGLAWLDGKYLGSSINSTTSTTFVIAYDSTSDTDWVSGGVVRQGLGSHGDFIQVLGGNTDNLRDDMTFRGLVFTHGEGVQDFTDGQGIYFQTAGGTCRIRNLLIDGCAIDTNTGNGILMDAVISCTIRNSAIVRNFSLGTGSLASASGARILITANGGDYSNIDIENCITNGYSNTPNITNSTMNLDETSLTDYQAMFDGPIPDDFEQTEYDGWVIWQTKAGGPGDQATDQGISNFDRTGLGYTGTIPTVGVPLSIGGAPLFLGNGKPLLVG